MLFAGVVLHPGSVAAWLAVGLIAAWLAGKVMETPSYGIMGDLLLGSFGAFVGGALPGFFVAGDPAYLVAVLTAFIGACILIVVTRVVAARLSA